MRRFGRSEYRYTNSISNVGNLGEKLASDKAKQVSWFRVAHLADTGSLSRSVVTGTGLTRGIQEHAHPKKKQKNLDIGGFKMHSIETSIRQ